MTLTDRDTVSGNERMRAGRTGENLALCEYVDRGMTAVAVNWRAGNRGELDVVVFDPATDTLCVCEVKTRTASSARNGAFSYPCESVGSRKIMKIKYSLKRFLAVHPEYSEKNIRFDVAEVYNIGGAYSVNIIEDAF